MCRAFIFLTATDHCQETAAEKGKRITQKTGELLAKATQTLQAEVVSFHPPEGQHCKLGPVSWLRAVLALRESPHLPSQKNFVAIGAHACDSCRLLKSVDLCNTTVEEIPEFTFVHCTSLKEILLPTTLHTIRVKAFMNCAALVELAIPPSLRYIGSRAFLDCTAFKRLAKMPGRFLSGCCPAQNCLALWLAECNG